MDGTVYREGQKYSFPNTLSKQFALVGGGAFTQPSFEDDVNNLGGIMGIFGTRLVINASVGAPQNLDFEEHQQKHLLPNEYQIFPLFLLNY